MMGMTRPYPSSSITRFAGPSTSSPNPPDDLFVDVACTSAGVSTEGIHGAAMNTNVTNADQEVSVHGRGPG